MALRKQAIDNNPSIQVYRISFYPLNDLVIPAFSSKLSFTLFAGFLSREWVEHLKKLRDDKSPLKPYRFSPVFIGDKALYKNSRDKMLVIHAGKRYWFTVTLIGLKPEFSLVDRLRVFGVEVVVDEIEMVTKKFDDLASWNSIDEFKIYFRSPTLLSPKLCLPPKTRVDTEYKVYRLYPQPCLWVRSMVSYWNKYAPPDLRLREGYKFSRLADIYLMETSHSIRPVTAYYSKNKNLIEHRGFTGWIKYKIIDKEFSKKLTPLLQLAELVGIGKSRNIGFGFVEIEEQGE